MRETARVKCSRCGWGPEDFADEAAWIAFHSSSLLCGHSAAQLDEVWQHARVVPVTSRQGKRIQRERERLAREQAAWRRKGRRVRHNAACRRWRVSNPDAARAQLYDWRQRNPDAQRAIGRRSYWRHRDEILLRNAVYRRDNTESIRAQHRAYYQGNAERERATAEQRRRQGGARPRLEIVCVALAFEDEVTRLHAEGWIYREIAELCGKTPHSVANARQRRVHKRNPGLCPCERQQEAG